MKTKRRQFGKWALYDGRPATLACMPSESNIVYHVPIEECQTQQGYEDWIEHLMERNGNYDIPGFTLAIQTLRAEGKYLKPLDSNCPANQKRPIN
jgi:hypothetical protein